MSNIGLIIEEKAADIGNFLVGRLLPFREKRAVGPFVFIDHMGPVHLKAGENIDVKPHPHVGLSTLTSCWKVPSCTKTSWEPTSRLHLKP